MKMPLYVPNLSHRQRGFSEGAPNDLVTRQTHAPPALHPAVCVGHWQDVALRHLSEMLREWTKCLFNPSVLATFCLTRFCLHVTETGHDEQLRVKGLAQEPKRGSLSSCDLSSQSIMVQCPSDTEMMTWMAKSSQTRAECSAGTNDRAWS